MNATFGYDAYGYPTSTVAGTKQNYSYNFDTVTGNLNWRQNNKYSGLREDFHYDNLDRLDDVYKGSTMTLDMAYDGAKGGITTKSDAGTFLYNTPERPYAMSSINPQTTLTPSAGQTLTYTSFGSVNTIAENNYTATFLYNSDNERVKMLVKQGTSTKMTRWYSTNSYIKETAGSTTKEYTFIGGDSYTAPVVAITQSGTTTYYNLLRDYLGNITHVINASTKAVKAEYSFDAWGRIRNSSTWAIYAPGSEPALFVAGRGFTGHEHLPWFNLINMNGRVYDALIGMFLSPDNYVQNPGFTQSFNRYGYCLNNPLKYSDPSGMVIAPSDFGRDIDAYQNWMCDVGGGYHIDNGGGPGEGRNGKGLNGVYYDWETGTMRSVSTGDWVPGSGYSVSDIDYGLTCGAAVAMVNSFVKDVKEGSFTGFSPYLENYKVVKQLQSQWCAFACAAAIFDYYGIKFPSLYGISLGQLIIANAYYKKNNISTNNGSDIPVGNYTAYLNQFYSLNNNYFYSHITTGDIRQELAAGHPVLYRGIQEPTSHAMVIVGFYDGGYIVGDPNYLRGGAFGTLEFSVYELNRISITAIYGVNPNF